MTIEEELILLKDKLRVILGEKRHSYDYTAKWHYLAASREEWKELLASVGMEVQAAKFEPLKKVKKQ